MTPPVEDVLRETLHSIPVDPAPDRLTRVLVRARRRRQHRLTVIASVLTLTAASAAVLTAAKPWSTSHQQSKVAVAPPSSYPGDPPIRYLGNANTTGTLEDNVTHFGPPQDPSAAIPARDALHDAWLHRMVTTATEARLVLAHLTSPTYRRGRDAWLVILYGHARMPTHGPSRRPHTMPAEPSTEVLDARTGHVLFTFSGGPPRDPMSILIAKPGATAPVEGDLFAVGGPGRRHPATPLQGTVTFTPLASRGSGGDTPPVVTAQASQDGHFVAHLEHQSYAVYATSPQFNSGHSRCYPRDRNPIDPGDTHYVTVSCQRK
jgi:hypothetical protein